MSAIHAERDYVIEEDFMKAVRKVADAKKLESMFITIFIIFYYLVYYPFNILAHFYSSAKLNYEKI
jgi:hypothetical protein